MIQFAFSTHIGLTREKQEDAFGNVGSEFFVIADGLGGHPAGEVAANLAVTEAIKRFKELKLTQFGRPPKLCELVFEAANKRIIEEVKRDMTKRGMATTMVAALIEGNNWWVGNIGDSRGYFFSQGLLTQITIDHKIPLGALTRAVGLEEEAIPDIFQQKAKKDDILLLTTDGLTNFVPDSEVKQVFLEDKDIKDQAKALVELSLKAGGLDNVTVCLIKWYS